MASHRSPETSPRLGAVDSFLALFAGFEAAFLELDHEGVVEGASDGFCALVGLPSEQVLGAGWPYPWLPDDQHAWFLAQLGPRFQLASRRGKFSGAFVHRDGSRFEIVGNVAKVRRTDGERHLMAVRDAATLRRSVSALAGAAATASLHDEHLVTPLQRLFDANLIGIIVGEEDRILAANDAFLDIIGYSRTELDDGGIDWPRLTPPEWLLVDAEAGEVMLRTGRAGPIEKQYFHRDGHRVWVRLAGAVVQWDPFRWVSFVEDVDPRRRAEEARAEAERALAAQADALAAGNALLDRLSQRVAHDLKTPLAALRTLVTLLDRTLDTEQDAQVRSQISAALDRLDTVVNDLPRVPGGGEPLRQNVDLEALVTTIGELLRADLTRAGGELVHGPLPAVIGSRAGLHSVLHNLVTNSLHHRSPDRAPRVEVSVTVEADQWLVAVSDNGTGIPEVERQNVFEYRRRGRHSASDGTGLGLAAARTIVESHGGAIWIEDVDGPGCRVVFSLPRPAPAG